MMMKGQVVPGGGVGGGGGASPITIESMMVLHAPLPPPTHTHHVFYAYQRRNGCRCL